MRTRAPAVHIHTYIPPLSCRPTNAAAAAAATAAAAAKRAPSDDVDAFLNGELEDFGDDSDDDELGGGGGGGGEARSAERSRQ